MIQKYFFKNNDQHASKWTVLVIDLCIVAFSFFIAYFIRFNLTFNFDVERLWIQLPFVVTLYLTAFIASGSYKGVIRHTGIKDVYTIFNSICLASIGIIVIILINRQVGMLEGFTIPLSIIIINSLLTFLALTASRYIFKVSYENLIKNDSQPAKKILIYGAGESGIITYNTLTNHSLSLIHI